MAVRIVAVVAGLLLAVVLRRQRPHREDALVRARQDDDPDLVISFCPQQSRIELDEEPPVLGVPGVRAIQGDHDDPPVVCAR